LGSGIFVSRHFSLAKLGQSICKNRNATLGHWQWSRCLAHRRRLWLRLVKLGLISFLAFFVDFSWVN
jgi:hypothetical protein